ncbi:MAG TPA: transcription termination factor NusA [Bryobacteraceae bacterium]
MASIYQSIEILSKEKGIDPQIVLDAVKDAMLAAARKHFRSTEDLVADLDEASGNIQIYGVKQVVDAVEDPTTQISLPAAKKIDPDASVGSSVRVPKPTDVLGRISAQTAKQVILQKVREAERDSVYSEFQGRSGELVNTMIKRLEGQDLVVDMGKTEARLPKKEQSRVENFSIGDRVRCVIKGVERGGKYSGVIVSRAAPELVMRLFEQEVPEIYDNTVAIKACAREAGERTKIAVFSRDRDVDSVGACVGMKGMRVQSIIRELRGEKIDIIEYSEDPVQYVTKALSPAKISRVTILDPVEKHMEVVVDDLQLSLAIGKRGQNVRLAARLIGWKIDIKSEEEKRRELESRMADMVISGAPVSILIDYGLPEQLVEMLVGAGIGTVERLGSMTPEELEAIPGITEETVSQIQAVVVTFYGQYEEQQTELVQEEAPANVEGVEEVLDASSPGNLGEDEEPMAFENIETGVLEHDLARHEPAQLDETEEGEVLDLGQVEGLSAAPSTLKDVVEAGENGEGAESDTMKNADNQPKT